MAKLSNLMLFMAEILGDPALKPDVYARPLRKEGLLKTGPRGPGAPDMTGEDCINLLLAIMGSAPAYASAKTVRQYRGLVLQGRSVGPRGRRSTRPERTTDLHYEPLEKLDELPYFVEALDLLVIRAVDGKLADKVASWQEDDSREAVHGEPAVTVQLLGPQPAALIMAPALGHKKPLRYAPLGPDAPYGDLVRASQITHQTILRLGEFLR